MTELHNNGVRVGRSALFIVLLLNCLSLFITSAITAQTKPRSATTPGQALARGKFYYDNGDTSEAAPDQFRQIIKQYSHSREAEEAQFYLASYYQRKYYITRERWRKDYPESLDKARTEYKEYIAAYSKGGSGNWLSDARFNLSLVYLELENVAQAIQELTNIALFDSTRDPSIYVYQIIWSPAPEDVVSSDFSAKDLAEYTRVIAQVHYRSGDRVESIVPLLKKWCQRYRLDKAAQSSGAEVDHR